MLTDSNLRIKVIETRELNVLDLKYAISTTLMSDFRENFPSLLFNTIHTLWAPVSTSASAAPPSLPDPGTVKPERLGNPLKIPGKITKTRAKENRPALRREQTIHRHKDTPASCPSHGLRILRSSFTMAEDVAMPAQGLGRTPLRGVTRREEEQVTRRAAMVGTLLRSL